jgi:hypothetical protein
MEYKQLNQIRDTYPGKPDTISESYTSKEGKTQLTGLYPQNFIHFDVIDISDLIVPDIQITGNVSFRFIVRFINGDTVEDWTSPEFLSDLRTAKLENNPYFTKDRITIAEINFQNLGQYWERNEFKIPELYANVTINDTITSKEDILAHIDWMVDTKNRELRPVRDFGRWTVSLTDSLGFEYSDAIENIQQDEPFERIRTNEPRSNQDTTLAEPRGDTSTTSLRDDSGDGTRSNTTTTGTRGDGTTSIPRSTTTTTPISTRTSSTNTSFVPFNSAGRYTGETRTSNGSLYIWGDNKWNIINN